MQRPRSRKTCGFHKPWSTAGEGGVGSKDGPHDAGCGRNWRQVRFSSEGNLYQTPLTVYDFASETQRDLCSRGASVL